MKNINVTKRCFVYGEEIIDINLTSEENELMRIIYQKVGLNLTKLRDRDFKSVFNGEKLKGIRDNLYIDYKGVIRKILYYMLNKKLKKEAEKNENFISNFINSLNENTNVDLINSFFQDLINRFDEIVNCVSYYISWKFNDCYSENIEVYINHKNNDDIDIINMFIDVINKRIQKEKENLKDL